jgi:hypothetical protein
LEGESNGAKIEFLGVPRFAQNLSLIFLELIIKIWPFKKQKKIKSKISDRIFLSKILFFTPKNGYSQLNFFSLWVEPTKGWKRVPKMLSFSRVIETPNFFYW